MVFPADFHPASHNGDDAAVQSDGAPRSWEGGVHQLIETKEGCEVAKKDEPQSGRSWLVLGDYVNPAESSQTPGRGRRGRPRAKRV